MKHLKKHPKQQRMEDMTFPITKMGKKMNKIIAKELDKKDVDSSELGSELTLDKLEAQFRRAFDPEMDTCFICNPPRPNRKHKTMGGKPVHERDDLPIDMVYMVNEDMFCLSENKEKVIWEGREWLRSINDDMGFTLMPRLAWRVVAVGVLVGAVIYFLSKAL